VGNKLYVGNLSFRVTSEDLQEHFAAAGAVSSANVVYDRETGRSRGFGFVEMADDSSANAAIAQFNGSEYDGRNMVVNKAAKTILIRILQLVYRLVVFSFASIRLSY